jgi:hypothetical protein
MATILIIYIAIFVFVKIQTKALDKSFSTLTSSGGGTEDSRSSVFHSRKGPKIRLKRPENWKEHISKFFSQFPGLGYLYPYKLIVEDSDRDLSVDTDVTALDNRQLTEYLQNVVSSENYLQFQRRRADIERQVSFLFIYPIVYVLIWTFPLVQEYHSSIEASWINILATWFRPFSGLVNSVVFVLKESQYPCSIEGQNQQSVFPKRFVDRNQPPRQAPLKIDATSDFIYEPKLPSPLEDTGKKVTDSRRRGSQKWARKLENYSLNLDEEQTIGTAKIPRYLPSEDATSPREKPESSNYYRRQPSEEPKLDIEPTDSNAEYYDLMDFLRAKN